MIKRLLLILGLLSWSGSALSQVAISGPGANSCAVFLDLYRQNPEPHQILFFAWAQGFMSGMNTVALRLKGEVIDLHPETYLQGQQMAFLRAYCEAHPARTYSEAVFELMTYLRQAGSQ